MALATPMFTMIGRTIVAIEGGCVGSERIIFRCSAGEVFSLSHTQDCCESVEVNEIIGDIEDLIGSPLVEAEEVSNYEGPEVDAESYTWTFYKFGTAKGFVTIRWLGQSNGYYSESVSFDVVNLQRTPMAWR